MPASMTEVRWYGLLFALTVTLGLLFGGTESTLASGPSPATHTVIIEGVQFTPAALTVRAGDAVTWINRDPFPHTATSNQGRFDSHAIEPGRSWTFTPRKAGVTPYGCMYHPTMKGTLRVE
jgi:plastocyanin